MPYYDYNCADCGPFTEMRPMAASAEPWDCPTCSRPAPRAFFTTPFFSGLDAGVRTAISTNERAQNEPKRSKSIGHGPGCGCCGSKKPSKSVYRADGSKTFPSARPWMISH